MQPLFNGSAQFDVARGHFWCDFATLEEAQHSVDPGEVVQGLTSFCAL
jgi:hypothetical protein